MKTWALLGIMMAMVACEESSNSSSSGTGAGSTTSGAGGGTSGGNTTGGSTTGGSLKSPGSPCGADSQCTSDICGVADDGGNCCASKCSVGSTLCSQPTGCDDGGQCTYTIDDTNCGTICTNGMYAQKICEGGDCIPGAPLACPSGMCNASGTGCE